MSEVVVINPFDLSDVPSDAAVAAWDKLAEYFSRQPGYLSAQLHQALDGSARFQLETVARWESVDAFHAALGNPELAQIAGDVPEMQSFPGVYQVIRG